MYRFGITMRMTTAQGYAEQRDVIASDWSDYMLAAFPDSQFVFIPNIEEKVIRYIEDLNINVVILSGGDDIGVYPKRDYTETLILKHALNNKIPIIAICRGMQLVHTYFGGNLKTGNEYFTNLHRATRHSVEMEGTARIVNSFHTNKIVEKSIAECFEIYARCKDDNTVEGIQTKGILAMMWHPEREVTVVEWNKLLIQFFLENEK